MTVPEPICCEQPMIHNSFTGEFECAEAYLVLHAAGIDPYLADPAALRITLRDNWEHWNGSRVSDGGAA